MHAYRTHNCAQLSAENVGDSVRLSGWIHRKRDHGGVLFIDLRDHYGMTQIVADEDSAALTVLEKLRPESVVTIDGDATWKEISKNTALCVYSTLPKIIYEAATSSSSPTPAWKLEGTLISHLHEHTAKVFR
mgnify:CR=1 FL=1